MAQFEDKVLHELDGIKEYDNAMPGWLMAIWWGSPSRPPTSSSTP